MLAWSSVPPPARHRFHLAAMHDCTTPGHDFGHRPARPRPSQHQMRPAVVRNNLDVPPNVPADFAAPVCLLDVLLVAGLVELVPVLQQKRLVLAIRPMSGSTMTTASPAAELTAGTDCLRSLRRLLGSRSPFALRQGR